MSDKLAQAFGIESLPVPPPGVHVKGPRENSEWQFPAWKTMVPPRHYGGRPDGWDDLESLKQVGTPPYDSVAMIRYREGVERKLRDLLLTRGGRQTFGRRYLGREYTGYQLDMLDDYFAGGQYVWMVFTEGGKSTVGCVDFPIMSLANDPNEPHTICCTSESEAKNRLRAIKYQLEGNHALIRDYPWLAKPRRGVWGATEINVDGRDSGELSQSVWACGRGNAQLKGHRGKTVFDDLEGKRSRDRAEVVEDMKRWFWTEAIRAYQTEGEAPRPLLAVQGTPFTIGSFYFDFARREGWRVRRRPYQNADGTLAWPRLASKIHTMKRSMDRIEFAIAMQLDPTGGDSSILTAEELEAMTDGLKPMPPNAGMFVTLDPGTQGGSDYAGLAVVQYHWPVEEDLPIMNVYAPRAWFRDIYEQVMEARRLAHAYRQNDKPLAVIYETNGRQKQDYGAMFKRFAPEIELVPHWTNDLAKMDKTGFTVVKTMLRRGRLGIFASPNDEDGMEGKEALLKEIRDLGSSRNDHLVAAVWFVFQHAFQEDRWRKTREGVDVYRQEGSEVRLVDRRTEERKRPSSSPYFRGAPMIGPRQGGFRG